MPSGTPGLAAMAVVTSASVMPAAATTAASASSFWSSALPALAPFAASSTSLSGFTPDRSTSPARTVFRASTAWATASADTGVPDAKASKKPCGSVPASLATSSSVSGVMLTLKLPLVPVPACTEW
jgi:hypothetical protein